MNGCCDALRRRRCCSVWMLPSFVVITDVRYSFSLRNTYLINTHQIYFRRLACDSHSLLSLNALLLFILFLLSSPIGWANSLFLLSCKHHNWRVTIAFLFCCSFVSVLFCFTFVWFEENRLFSAVFRIGKILLLLALLSVIFLSLIYFLLSFEIEENRLFKTFFRSVSQIDFFSLFSMSFSIFFFSRRRIERNHRKREKLSENRREK